MIPQRNFSKKGRLKVKKGRLKVLLMRTKYTWRLSNSGGSESLWSAHASSHGASTVDFTARVRLRNGSRSAARESVVRRCAWSRAESASINRCPPVMMWRTSWGGASLRITDVHVAPGSRLQSTGQAQAGIEAIGRPWIEMPIEQYADVNIAFAGARDPEPRCRTDTPTRRPHARSKRRPADLSSAWKREE